MGLFQRMSGLISANLNDLIEHCEDPEKMLRQAVREMETALGQLMDGAAGDRASQVALSAISGRARHDLAYGKAGRESGGPQRRCSSTSRTGAKGGVPRLVDTLEAQVATADALGHRLRRQVTAMRLKLAEARRKLVDVSARKRAAAAQRKFVSHLPDQVGSGQAWSSFDSLCARVAQSEAETEALLELLGQSDNAAPFDAEVEAELRALKEAANHVTC